LIQLIKNGIIAKDLKKKSKNLKQEKTHQEEIAQGKENGHCFKEKLGE